MAYDEIIVFIFLCHILLFRKPRITHGLDTPHTVFRLSSITPSNAQQLPCDDVGTPAWTIRLPIQMLVRF